jgi:hypothetical protein
MCHVSVSVRIILIITFAISNAIWLTKLKSEGMKYTLKWYCRDQENLHKSERRNGVESQDIESKSDIDKSVERFN